MPYFRTVVFLGLGIALLACSQASRAQSFAPVGDLDCNGYSKIQKPVKPRLSCADFRDRTVDAATITVTTSDMTSRALASFRRFLILETMYSGTSHCRASDHCRLNSLSSSFLPFGSRWRYATPTHSPMVPASRIAMRTLRSLPDRRSSNCSSILPDFLRSLVVI